MSSDHSRLASRVPRLVLTLIAGIALLVGFAAPEARAADIPRLASPVTDLTNTLTESQRRSLEETLLAFAERKGSQVAVLIVPTVEPDTIEQYSMRVAEAWKLGRAAEDDGVLFVIAKDDRVMRIEVGYGLEGALTDIEANRIIRQTVTPHFRAGDYYLGIVHGVDLITRAIEGEALPPPTVAERARRPGSGFGQALPVLLFGAMAVAGVLRRLFGRFAGASILAGGIGFIFWLLMGVWFVALIAAFIAFAIGLLSGGGGGWNMGGRRRWNSGGSWGGSGRSWGGGGFGGFSGGGGGFGGGGASGRW